MQKYLISVNKTLCFKFRELSGHNNLPHAYRHTMTGTSWNWEDGEDW